MIFLSRRLQTNDQHFCEVANPHVCFQSTTEPRSGSSMRASNGDIIITCYYDQESELTKPIKAKYSKRRTSSRIDVVKQVDASIVETVKLYKRLVKETKHSDTVLRLELKGATLEIRNP